MGCWICGKDGHNSFPCPRGSHLRKRNARLSYLREKDDVFRGQSFYLESNGAYLTLGSGKRIKGYGTDDAARPVKHTVTPPIDKGPVPPP